MNLLKALLATAFLVRFSWASVVDLGLDNLARTIKSNKWTVVLFYDGNNEKKNKDLEQMMNALDETISSNAPTVGFAKLDVRRHPAYRKAYSEHDDWPFINQYYTKFPETAESSVSISHKTFMNLNGDLYWPAKILLMAYDFNVYSEQDTDLNGDFDATISILARWIEVETAKEPDEDDVLIQSPINKEIERSLVERDNTFTFTRYFENLAEVDEDNDEQTTSFLLEAGASENADEPFKHQRLTRESYDKSGDWLDIFSFIVSRYLNWAQAYESLWDDSRKAREDEQTKYGSLLEEMNMKLQYLLDATFGSNDKSMCSHTRLNGTVSSTIETKNGIANLESIDDEGKACISQRCDNAGTNASEVAEEIRQVEVTEEANAVPMLRSYFDEIVFGYGRSPASLGKYLREEVLLKLGEDAKARREAREVTNFSGITLFERMREYMKIVEDTNNDESLYLNTLADLTIGWHNILVEFHDKLTANYLEYIEKNPLAYNTFKRHEIEVLDMNDPNNFELLTDYDEFHRRYTQTGVPVVLGNVNMTNHQCTMEYMIEQCGSADVTQYVRLSNPVGGKSTRGWGGLEKYTLDDDLLNDEREENDDRDLTLEQFVALSQTLDNIYLHDYALPDECERILYDETMYGEHQKFRIPSILASYDLFHRVPLYGFSSSWPSLFIGKKGSNSKIHVDAGGSGFFMYLVSGRKRWIVTKPSERPYLYENTIRASMAADVLGIDKSDTANEYLSKRFPLLHRAEDVYEVIQEPGQLVYIPPDSPHAVENLDDIVGIALNLIPRDALARHFHDQIHYTRAFGYSELALKYMLFEDNALHPVPTKDPLYATFAEYKAQV